MQQQSIHRSQLRSRGFTLVELMVTVAVIGILAVIAAPGMTAMVNSSRLNSQITDLHAVLQLARSEAVRRNMRVTVCSSANGSSCAGSTGWGGWLVRGADTASCTNPADVSTCTVVDDIKSGLASGNAVITGSDATIAFRANGMLDGGNTRTLDIAVAGTHKCITVMVSGVVSSAAGAC